MVAVRDDRNNMSTIQIVIAIAGGIFGLVVSFGVIVYAYGQLIQGKKAESSDETKQNTQTIYLLREQIASLQLMSNDNLKEISYLKGKLEEKDKIITDLTTKLANQDPNSAVFVQLLTDTAKNAQEFMVHSSDRYDMFTKILVEVRDSLKILNRKGQ